MATFVLNDEKVINSYGFRTLNAGIDLTRFKSNPVMLDDHWNGTASVVGRWKNLRTEGSKLLADDEFDEEDEAAKKLKGKVDRGYIKSCSMGLLYNRANMKANADGSYTLEKSELMEASIVAIPSNANSLRLYAANTGVRMTDGEVKLSIQNLKPENTEMEKIILSAAALIALGLNSADDANAVSTAIERLKKDLDNEKNAHTALKATVAANSKTAAESLVDEAINQGRLKADMRDDFVKMAMDNHALAAKVIAGMPAKQSLGGKVDNPASGATAVKSIDDFMKLSHEEQLQFKADNPAEYAKLFA